jgi:hypothetical protein
MLLSLVADVAQPTRTSPVNAMIRFFIVISSCCLNEASTIEGLRLDGRFISPMLRDKLGSAALAFRYLLPRH